MPFITQIESYATNDFTSIILQTTCPPFNNIGVDLCGPLIVHAMTNKCATMKVWNVIIVCLNTKAVSMHLAPGYSTDDFFMPMIVIFMSVESQLLSTLIKAVS